MSNNKYITSLSTPLLKIVKQISIFSKEEADKLFNGLSVGGQIEGIIGDSTWGSYFGCFRDKYGIEWIVEFNPKNNGII